MAFSHLNGSNSLTQWLFNTYDLAEAYMNGSLVFQKERRTEQTFTKSGIFYVPQDVCKVELCMIAGGGTGAIGSTIGDTVSGGPYGGGHAGEVVSMTVPVTPGEQIQVTVGEGGAFQNVAPGSFKDGLPGEDTSFGSIVAQGGLGGTRGDGTSDYLGQGASTTNCQGTFNDGDWYESPYTGTNKDSYGGQAGFSDAPNSISGTQSAVDATFGSGSAGHYYQNGAYVNGGEGGKGIVYLTWEYTEEPVSPQDQELIGSGNFIVPIGVYELDVCMIGGGGSGSVSVGDTAGDIDYTNGGYSGDIINQTINVTPGQVISYATGTGAAGAVVTTNNTNINGVAGTATTFGALTAAGGLGGTLGVGGQFHGNGESRATCAGTYLNGEVSTYGDPLVGNFSFGGQAGFGDGGDGIYSESAFSSMTGRSGEKGAGGGGITNINTYVGPTITSGAGGDGVIKLRWCSPTNRDKTEFDTSGTFTVPPNIYLLDICGIAGGESGGCSDSAGYEEPGWAGEYVQSSYNVTPGDVITVTVGTGGPRTYSRSQKRNAGTNTIISVPGYSDLIGVSDSGEYYGFPPSLTPTEAHLAGKCCYPDGSQQALSNPYQTYGHPGSGQNGLGLGGAYKVGGTYKPTDTIYGNLDGNGVRGGGGASTSADWFDLGTSDPEWSGSGDGGDGYVCISYREEVLRLELPLTTSATPVNLRTFIDANNPQNLEIIEITNNNIHPSIVTGDLTGLQPTLINYSEINGSYSGYDGLTLTTPLKVLNYGVIRGAGGNGGNGGTASDQSKSVGSWTGRGTYDDGGPYGGSSSSCVVNSQYYNRFWKSGGGPNSGAWVMTGCTNQEYFDTATQPIWGDQGRTHINTSGSRMRAGIQIATTSIQTVYGGHGGSGGAGQSFNNPTASGGGSPSSPSITGVNPGYNPLNGVNYAIQTTAGFGGGSGGAGGNWAQPGSSGNPAQDGNSGGSGGAGGIALDGYQLALPGSVFGTLVGGNYTFSFVFDTDGSFTVPTGVTSIDLCMIAGGGSGASGEMVSNSAGGGYAGQSMTINTPVTPGDVIPYTIGIGGAAVYSSYAGIENNGNPGTATTFGVLSVNGGAGGTFTTDDSGAYQGDGNVIVYCGGSITSHDGTMLGYVGSAAWGGQAGFGDGGDGKKSDSSDEAAETGGIGAGGGGHLAINSGRSGYSGAGGNGQIRISYSLNA